MTYGNMKFGNMNLRKRNTQRRFTILIAVIAALFLMPQLLIPVYGADREDAQPGKTYDVNNKFYDVKKPGTYTFNGSSTKKNITIDCSSSGAGSPVVINLNSVNINIEGDNEYPAINIKSGYVKIYINGTNTLTGGHNTGAGTDDGAAGIRVNGGATLELLGNGKLTVQGGGPARGAAGIGSNYNVSDGCGAIIIGNSSNAPAIEAKGGGYQDQCDGAAGIGGGYDGSSGSITIHNGTVTATGSGGAAGIGGGEAYASGAGGQGNNITINGGTVTAKGSSGAPGIGGGCPGSSGDGGNTNNITINGGTITATGGDSAAGIGGSKDGVTRNLIINGGTITATGGEWAAGIGAGNAVSTGGGGAVHGLKITGGTITATGGKGAAGIGGSDEGDVSDLKIQQASGKSLSITATGGDYGAGIGNGNTGAAGNAGMIQNDIEKIDISLKGGAITAVGGYGGAGIGGGNSKADNIEIYGYGTIKATGGDHSSAIGAGKKEDGGDITIKGTDGGRDLIIYGYATKSTGSNDAAVIGGADSAGGDIAISNAVLYLDSPDNSMGAAIGSGLNGSMIAEGMGDITITNCYIDDKAYSDRRAVSIGAGFSSIVDNITIRKSEVHGGAIGCTDNGNEAFRDVVIDSITIEDSIIVADNRVGQKAAIGGGRYAGIKSITIKRSDVTARTDSGAGIGSGGYTAGTGDPLKWNGAACGDVYIEASKVEARGGDGAAGIGGGWGTPVGDVTIVDCNGDKSIIASSGDRDDDQGGAGIGGGWGESSGNISISNSNVTANGAGQSAGIGSGGTDTSASFWWNTTCHAITIDKNSTITATGGAGGAGIGTGEGAQFSGDAVISIDDSSVTASGGEHGAGIGAGDNAYMGSGAESCDVEITGTSKVTATGGTGGAGIGGGYDGGCDSVSIALDKTEYKNGEWTYYVKATGGKGAAGIGSGGVYVDPDDKFNTAQHGHDIETVDIAGGYVLAQGGVDENGAGAGIGGGAKGGNLNNLYVSGGFIEAHAGTNYSASWDAADDIGTGGEDNRNAIDNSFTITGGVVLGGLSDEPKIIINGGSVRHKTDAAKRSDGTKVYRTQMKVEGKYAALDDLETSVEYYGKDDVIPDESQKVYLYLPESEATKATADFKIGESKHSYYNKEKINSSGDNWLKMGAEVDIILMEKDSDKQIEAPMAGQECRARAVHDLTGKVTYTVDDGGKVKLLEEPGGAAVDELTLDLDAGDSQIINLIGKDFGSFTISLSGTETDIYWDVRGTYEGTITRSLTSIAITEDPSKVYDGEPAEHPGVNTNSNGEISYVYYKDDGKTLLSGGAPTDAGDYYVKAVQKETDRYAAAESELKAFSIKKRPTMLSLSANGSISEASATVYAEVTGLCSITGKVCFTAGTMTEEIAITKDDKGGYVAKWDLSGVAADEYKVKAEFVDDSGNYETSSDTQTFIKDKNYRRILITPPEKQIYGDEIFSLTVEATRTQDEKNNQWSYEVIKQIHNDTIKIDGNGNITINNAGIAIVKVTLTDSADPKVYEDATAYAMVTVGRKELTVTSYAANKDGDKITDEQKYGTIDDLQFLLKYEGFVNERDTEADFTKGHGSLEAVPLSKTTGVGTHEIGINRIGNENGVFLSRNYKIREELGELKIVKDSANELIITPDDITGEYGVEPEYTYTTENLMDWDTPETAFGELPVAGLARNKKYKELKPGEYKKILGIINKNSVTSSNYYFAFGDNADLTINKASLSLNIERAAKVYDGEAFEVKPMLDTGSSLAYDGKVEYEYFRITKDGMKRMMSAPKDVGFYIVKAKAPDTNCYEGDTDIALLRIKKALSNPEIPQLPDIYCKDGLTLADQKLPKGWSWYRPDRELSVGSVGAYAIYTPEDPANYRSVVEMLWFDVLEKDEKNGGMGKPEGKNDGKFEGKNDGKSAGKSDGKSAGKSDGKSAGKSDGSGKEDSAAGTGDLMNPVLWGIIMMTAVFAAAIAMTLGRRKERRM